VSLLCKCMNLDGTCPNEHYADTPEGRASEGFRSPASGYGEVTVILGARGPEIQGELRILHTRWRQIGMDGVDVHIFERVPE
jgi:hypothetical protein